MKGKVANSLKKEAKKFLAGKVFGRDFACLFTQKLGFLPAASGTCMMQKLDAG